jgi:hypothetical protein
MSLVMAERREFAFEVGSLQKMFDQFRHSPLEMFFRMNLWKFKKAAGYLYASYKKAWVIFTANTSPKHFIILILTS